MNDDEKAFIANAMAYFDDSANKKREKLKRQLQAAEDYANEMALSRREGYEDGLLSGLLEDQKTIPSYKKDFPSWAPSVLRIHLAHSIENNLNDNYGFILKKLCTDTRMEFVWEQLGKNFTHTAEVQGFAALAYLFSKEVKKAYFGWEGWGSLTKKQGDKKIKLILKLLSDLSQELENFPVSDDVISELTGDELSSLKTGFARDALSFVRFDMPDYFVRMVEDAAYDQPVHLSDIYLKNKMPSIKDILDRVKLRLINTEFVSRTTNNSDSGQLRFFIRSLSGFMTTYYGSRKDAQLAELGNIFFDRFDLDSKKVADLFR